MSADGLAVAPCRLAPAGAFSIEQLTSAYNQTRVDYLVPMPMNAARLAEYLHVYDVDVNRSVVALDDEDRIVGLAMLGVRPGRAWITRLGVVPTTRRHGVGESLMRALLGWVGELGVDQTMLEVITNNMPAHRLFLKLGFREVRELLVLLRPPGVALDPFSAQVLWHNRSESLALLETRRVRPAWSNETESFCNAEYVLGLSVALTDGSRGWLVFQRQRFVIHRMTMVTEQGDAFRVGRTLLSHLYRQHAFFDTHTENIQVDDPHLPALLEAGFVESFRRIEMHLHHA